MVEHLYVHVPFCRARCAYCDFSSEPVGPHQKAGRVEACVAALRREIERAAPELSAQLETIYVGGGTPTVLPDELLLPLLRGLSARLASHGELTVEAVPGTFDATRLRALAEAGANRLSLGVQSFSPRLRSILGRGVTQGKLESALIALRESGWRNWNLDLIFGIPGGTFAEALADVARAVAAGATHISLYDLTYTERFAIRLERRAGAGARAEAAAFAEEHYADVVAALEGGGYRRYEVSNFALPGYECRHNEAYWRGADYVGVGPSAVGTVEYERRTNPSTVREYLAGTPPEIEVLTPDTKLFERAMLGLRTAEGVPEGEVAAVLDEAAVGQMVSQGYLRRACATLSMSPGGLDLSSAVLAAILRLPGGSHAT